MAGVGTSMGAHRELTGEGKRKQGRGLGAAWGAARGAMGLLLSLLVRAAAAGCFVLAVRERRQEGGWRKERKKKRNEKKKRKNMEIFSNLKISEK
jgi:hypothetical protein